MIRRHPVDDWLASRSVSLPAWIILQATVDEDARTYLTDEGHELYVRCGLVGGHRFMTMVVTGAIGSIERRQLAAIREAFFLPGRGVELRRTSSSVDVVQLWQLIEVAS